MEIIALAETTIQTTILRNLLHDEEYTRRVVPFLKKEYFEGAHRGVFDAIVAFVTKYNKLPTTEALAIEISDADSLSPDDASEASSLLTDLSESKDIDQQWLEDQTEKWCQDRAIYLAVMESINIIDGRHKELTKNALPELLKDALSVSFDTSVGHDYINDADSRYEFYHRTEEKIPFDLDYMNRITKGGLSRKSLNVILASTGVGKSMFMCHQASAALTQGKNVLYVTLEMAEEKIAERIDANLMNVPLDQIENLSYKQYSSKIETIAKRSVGKLIIKEYPTGSAHTGHFRALLEELKLKRDFVPDIIFVDYLNICSSARMRGLGGSINTYSLIKSIAEEVRGLAIEFNLPIVTATQSNREGFANSDVDLNNTSESFGVPATADMMFALISTEELENLGQVMVKQLKNRYSDPTQNKRFVIGVDKSRMRFYDVEDTAQDLIGSNAGPAFDSSASGARIGGERKDFSGVTV
jgi:replicative DNA helicase